MARSVLCAAWGLALPVIQAPMAGAQDSRLALAVVQAGGLGSLPAAALDPATLRQELQVLHRSATGPYNVNFFCHRPPVHDAALESAWLQALLPAYQAAKLALPTLPLSPGRTPFDATALALLLQYLPPVVSFHFGLPEARWVATLKQAGARILASATTVAEGLWLQQHGADAVIAQGWEAGGHRGMFLSEDLGTQLGTFALVPQLVQALQVPVVAAGGIADAAGVAAAQALGAAAVQVGTAYLLCPEACTSALHRQALASAAARHTAVTKLFTGRPARGIVNRFMREWGQGGQGCTPGVPPFPLATAAVAPLRAHAEALACADFSPLWAGQSAPLVQAMPAPTLTQSLGSAWSA